MSEDAPSSRVGSQFGPYLLKRLIGRGGMGEVYEAQDTVHDRSVALKLVLQSLSGDREFRERLQREARIAGRLQEPHVVPIHHCGEIDGQWYVDMRLIDGTDLHALLTRYGPLPPRRAVAIVRQIASALDAAHAAGVIHRDVKPENVLITGDDFAYLVDFGLANAATELRMTQLGTAVGTWAYMAPERFDNTEATYRGDIYALACVLYEALTGSRPFPAESVGAVINAHMNASIPRPSELRPGIPAGFDEVIARGMAKTPEDRYASAGDLALAAQNALSTAESERDDTTMHAAQAATLPAEGAVQPTAQHAAGPTKAAEWNPRNSPPAWSPPPQAWSPPPPSRPSNPQPFATPFGVSPAPQPIGHAPSGPFAAIPSGPQPFVGPNQLPGTPPPTPSRKRTPWILLGTAGLVFVAAISGVAIWLGTRDRGTGPNPPPPPPPPPDPQSQLLGVIPKGYEADTCKPVDPLADSLVTLSCGQNTEVGGPSSAVYTLYSSTPRMRDGFTATTTADGQTPEVCPGAEGSDPTTYHHTDTPGEDAGYVACGLYKGLYNVTWTDDGNRVLGYAEGANLDDLYRWWENFG